MFSKIILTAYFLISFIVLVLLTLALPRISKLDKSKPLYIYIAFYILNSIFLNYVIIFNPLKTILINVTLLIFSHLVGSRLRLIGLTGQICSGKSTVSEYLASKYKACIIDVDKLNREVLEMDEVKKEIRRKFGDEVFNDKNELDRMKMRKIIFSDINKRKQLEQITHGKVFKLLLKRIFKEKVLYHNQYVVIENALLLRFRVFKYLCFPILAVCTTKMAEIIGRVMSRDNCARDAAEKILAIQMKQDEFVKQSDYVIYNDSDLGELKFEVDKFMTNLNN